MTDETAADPYTAMLARLRLSARDASRLSDDALLAGAVAAGVSRLTAERVVALERGGEEVGRARTHVQSRPWTTPIDRRRG